MGADVSPAQAERWLAEQCQAVAAGDATALAIAFGHASRRHHDPSAARRRLVLAMPSGDVTEWLSRLDRLFATAGLDELVALYRCLSDLPHPLFLRLRAAEGARSSMQAVFEAVALDNAYPCRWLDDGPLNQMVLKAFFLGCDPQRIVDLRTRATTELGAMLAGYVRERTAAQRPLPAGILDVIAWCPSR